MAIVGSALVAMALIAYVTLEHRMGWRFSRFSDPSPDEKNNVVGQLLLTFGLAVLLLSILALFFGSGPAGWLGTARWFLGVVLSTGYALFIWRLMRRPTTRETNSDAASGWMTALYFAPFVLLAGGIVTALLKVA